MSLTIIKAGLLDTIQDTGRCGYQSVGINPNGAMDPFSAKLANALLGKDLTDPVIEFHFPASSIVFDQSTIISITGADFYPVIDHSRIELNRPVFLRKGAILDFKKMMSGARCYLSIYGSLSIKPWLNSFSTNLKAVAGGFQGRAFQKGDVIEFEGPDCDYFISNTSRFIPSWYCRPPVHRQTDAIEVLQAPEWEWLTEESRTLLQKAVFKISSVADRMGYRLTGIPLQLAVQKQLVSSGVTFGTLQLLPNGQLVVLMADHQTTGGYPRVANVVSAHLRVLAQKQPGDEIKFKLVSVAQAEQKLLEQHQYLRTVQHASALKIKEFFYDRR